MTIKFDLTSNLKAQSILNIDAMEKQDILRDY